MKKKAKIPDENAPQNEEQSSHAQLIIANRELAFQNQERENRAAELLIANKELAFQNSEKEKRAAELIIANKELAFQNKEKEKRAAELLVANAELTFQNEEKEKRAAELIIANKELVFQNSEKEKRANELLIANKELESFTFISSHDLQEPLRKIQAFSDRILAEEFETLSQKGKHYFERIQISAKHMQTLINDLLAYSRTTETERKFENVDLDTIMYEVMEALQEEILEKKATIEVIRLGIIQVIPFQFRQLLQNLITNALKFSNPEIPPHIVIKTSFLHYDPLNPEKFPLSVDCCHLTIADNGIGFKPEYQERIFDIFQRLHEKQQYKGTGIGLAIVKKIVQNHNGIITAQGEPGKGATFNIYLPITQVQSKEVM